MTGASIVKMLLNFSKKNSLRCESYSNLIQINHFNYLQMHPNIVTPEFFTRRRKDNQMQVNQNYIPIAYFSGTFSKMQQFGTLCKKNVMQSIIGSKIISLPHRYRLYIIL